MIYTARLVPVPVTGTLGRGTVPRVLNGPHRDQDGLGNTRTALDDSLVFDPEHAIFTAPLGSRV
jgi:hypothetical protein